MSDAYAYWRGALALVGDGGKLSRAQVAQLGGITTEPFCGFWAKPVLEIKDGKRTKKPPVAVAIWQTPDGKFAAKVNGVEGDAYDVWTWCAMTPISYETYLAVGENGQDWPAKEDAA